MKILKDLAVSGQITVGQLLQSSIDTDKFLVAENGVVKFRTGSEILSDIGGISGNQNITLSGDATGSGTTAITVALANSGVTAGTYTKVTVDAKGRVTAGSSLVSADLPTYTGTLTSSQVTTALGYTPYNSTNPSGYITSAALSGYATQSWVQSQGYLTSVSDVWVNTSGDTMTGALNIDYSNAYLYIKSANSGSGIQWHDQIWLGRYDRVQTASQYPNYLPGAAYGLHITQSSDAVFFGLISRGANSNDYNAVIAWGDDAGDILQFRFNNGVVASLTDGGTFNATNITINSAQVATQSWVTSQGYITGNQTITLSGDATGSGTTAITVALANSGVTAGTYSSVTVDAKGRVTAGTNPGYLTSYTETDTLATVTARGASTSTAVTFNNSVTINGVWQTNISTTGGWSKLSFTASNAWGDGITYGVLGAGGGNEPGVMTYNQHATWVGSANGAGIRMGRSGGVSSGAWYQVATMDSDEFMIAKNGSWGNGGLKINSSGVLYYGNTGYRYIWENGTWGINITGSAGSLSSMNISQFTNNSGYITSTVSGQITQNSGRFVRDSYYRTYSGFSDYYGGGSAGWYKVAQITLTGNCTGAVLFGTLNDNRYDGADAYQISIVARAECDFTSNNESHYINVGCTILGSTNYTNYRDKVRVLLVSSSSNSRTYELQFYETPWNMDTWEIQTTGWTVYTSPQAPGTSTGTARVNYISKINSDIVYVNTGTYSPIYYDSDSPGYYGDFAGTSNVNIINAQGLAVANALYFAGAYGNTYNSDTMYMQGRYVAGNIQALDLYIGDDGRNTVLPQITGGQDGSVDAFCIRATNDGIHHIFDSAGDAWHGRHLYTPNGNMYMGGNIVATQSWVSSQGYLTSGSYLPLSGGTMTGSIVNNQDGGVIIESNLSEANNWLWKENAKAWGLFWLNKGSQGNATLGGYTTVGAETLFMGGNAQGVAMPSGWTGYAAGSYINAMISNYNGYIWSSSTIYAQTSMVVGGNTVLHAGNYTSYSPSLTGSGASGTWGIRITGFANQGSQRLYSTDSVYNYDSANPYYGYLTYDGTYWLFQVSPATPSAVRVARADVSTQVVINSDASAAWYPVLWHSGNTVYKSSASSGVNIYAAGAYLQANYFNTYGGGAERNSSGISYVAGFNSSDYYIRSYNASAVQSWLGLGSMAYASTGSYLPLSGGSLTGALRINANWGAGGYSERLTIYGTYPSYAFRSTTTDAVWLHHMQSDGALTWYYGAGATAENWSMKLKLDSSGDLWRQNSTQYVYNSGTWGIGITGNAGSVNGRSVGNSAGNIGYFDSNGNLYVNNPESYGGEVRLGAAWGRGGVYASSTLSLSTSASQIHFVFGNGVPLYVNSSGSIVADGTIDFDGKSHYLGVSGGWDGVGFGNLTNLHFQGHSMFWIGAGNAYWWNGGVNTEHDLLITTMYGYDSTSYYRGITFAVDNNGNGNTGGYRLGRWQTYGSGWNTSRLQVDASLSVGYGNRKQGGAYDEAKYPLDRGVWAHGRDATGYGDDRVRSRLFSPTANGGGPWGSFASLEVSSIYEGNNDIPALFRMHQWGSGSAELWKPQGTVLYLRESPGGGGSWFTRFEVQGSLTSNNLLFPNGFQITQGGSNYAQFNSWVYLPGHHGFYAGVNGSHIYPNNGSYGAWRIAGSRSGWGGIEFDNGSAGNVTLMLANDSNTSGFHNNSYGWQIRWANGTLYVGKNAYGGNEATVIDSSSIGSQSVNYANYSGYADRIQTGNNQWTWSNGAHTVTNPNTITLWDQYSNYGGSGNPTSYGTIMDIYGRSGHEHDQLYFGESGQFLHRNCFYGTNSWSGWRTILNSSNYNSYSPTLTGGGASGTWSISVTGRADGALKLWATSHPNDYYIVNNWTGSHWYLTSNHGSPVRVGYADSAGSASSASSATYITIPDWRDTTYSPNQYNGNSVVFHFNNVGQNSGPAGNYWGAMMTVSPWSVYNDSHRQSQIWFGGSEGLSYRYAVGSGYTPTGWSGWERIVTSANIGSFGLPYGNWGGSTGMNDQKLYFRTNGDNNHFLWNADDDWEELRFYTGTGFRLMGSNGSTYHTFSTGNATFNTQVYVNRHIDANTTWGSCGCTSLFLGWGGGKVVLGNGNSGGHDYANGLGSNTVVSTNPFYCYQDITAYSDARVKENVEVIEDAVEKIKSIRGVTYTRNDMVDITKRHAGVIAQEVLEVLPEVVSEDLNGHYSVAYGNLTSLLIEAVKEQQKQIEELKSKLDAFTK